MNPILSAYAKTKSTKIVLILAFLPLAACDVLQQAAEDEVRNEVSNHVDATANEIRSRADEHLNSVAPELSNQIGDVQNRVEKVQQQHEELRNQIGQFK